MLKSIHIIIGTYGNIFHIKQFYANYQTLFNNNNIYHFDFNDLYPETNQFSFIRDSWIINNVLAKNTVHFSDVLNKLSEQIKLHAIEQLIVLLDMSALEDDLSNVYKLINTFSDANRTVSINLLNNPDKNYNQYLTVLTNANTACFQSPDTYILSPLYENKECYYKQLLEKVLHLPVTINTWKNEESYVRGVLKQLNLSVDDTFIIPGANYSQEVIAYLLALHTYHAVNGTLSFMGELDFLTYKNQEPSSSPKTRRIQFEDARILSKKLSPACRQALIKNITKDDIQFMPDSSKNVYLSLMIAEKQITSREMASLLPYEAQNIEVHTRQKNPNVPLLTVYTASYNNAEYLKKCIESVAMQETQYPFIHLISDDNSTDGSQELLLEYAKKYPHIRLILRKQNNLHANYYGIFNNLATKYAAVCDCDDFYIDKEKLEKQITFLEENPDCGLCFHSTYTLQAKSNCITGIHPNGISDFVPEKFYTVDQILQTNLMQSSSVMYRWKWSNGLTDDFPFACAPFDWTLNIVHGYNAKLGFINTPMSMYRRHEKAAYAATENNTKKHLIHYCFSELKFCKVLNKYTERKYERIFLETIFQLLYHFYISVNMIEYDKKEYDKQKNRIEEYFPEYIQFFKDNLPKVMPVEDTDKTSG